MAINVQRDVKQITDDYQWVHRLVELVQQYGTLCWQHAPGSHQGVDYHESDDPDRAYADIIDHLRVKFPDFMPKSALPNPYLQKEQPVDQPQTHTEPRPRNPIARRAQEQINLYIQALARTIGSCEIDQEAAEALMEELDILKTLVRSRVRFR